MNEPYYCDLAERIIHSLGRIADSLERTAPSGSASGALLSDPLAGQRQGDPLTSGSELALPDQGAGKRCSCPQCGGSGEDGFDRCHPPNPYICDLCQGSGLVFIRPAPAPQSAVIEGGSCNCCTPGDEVNHAGEWVCERCYQPIAREPEGASGSGNDQSLPHADE